MSEDTDAKRNVAKVIARAWIDPDYASRLKKDPEGELKKAGVAVPTKKVQVVADSDEVAHFVIPKRPAHLDEHLRHSKEHPHICSHDPKICSLDPKICSFLPELCSTGVLFCGGDEAEVKKRGTPTPDLCSFR